MRDQGFVAVHRGGSLTLEHHRLLIHWARKCVLHVLPLLEYAVDERLTFALETAEAWAQGKFQLVERCRRRISVTRRLETR